MKYEKKARLSRKEAAAWLAAVAEALSSDGDLEVERDGETFKLSVAEKVRFEFEIEIDGSETEIELELKWQNAEDSAPPAKPGRTARTSPAS